jgi:hypothetical protein
VAERAPRERAECRRPSITALRGHSRFSNQSPRTYAPKPAYAVRFWLERGLMLEKVDISSVIRRRARRFYSYTRAPFGDAVLADSRNESVFDNAKFAKPFSWVITSPPY